MWQSTFLTYRPYYCHLFCKSTTISYQHAWWALSKTELLWNSCDGRFSYDHTGRSLTGNRKQKKVKFLLEKVVAVVKKFKQWSLTREVLKQYLTEKQNGYFQSGRLQEVGAYEKWSLWGVDCSHLYLQEPDPEPVIKQFADGYGVKFDMFAKINVNGANALPLYKYLKSQLQGTLGR